MKQKTYIIIGIVTVLLLLGVWVYMLFFGTPKSVDDIWNDFNLGGEEDPTLIIEPEPVITEEPVVNLDRPRLRQLTTKPVIGFKEVQVSTTSAPVMYYAEAGTGHLYTIDLVSGTEERISNTTIPEANYASFSGDGAYVAVRSKNDKRANTFVWAEINNTSASLSLNTVDAQAYDFKIISATELIYTTRSVSGLTANALDLSKNTKTELFTLPFYEATMMWGSSTQEKHYAYPKATYAMEGYLYGISKKTMSRLPIDGFGLTAFTAPNYIMYTKMTEFVPKTYIYNTVTDTHDMSPFVLMPEKCVTSQKVADTIWCGNDTTMTLPVSFPDTWYKGMMSFKDTIWKINPSSQTADPIVDTFTESKREIDIINMSIGSSESALYFINKNDNTLWMYEL